jgi:heme/copper-type cytochrome/quinol oxidase subunit 2
VTLRTAIFWIAAACCVVAELAILRSLLFGRAAEAGRPGAGRTKRATEIAWALLPAAGLLVVLYLTWRAVDAPQTRSVNVAERGVTIGV